MPVFYGKDSLFVICACNFLEHQILFRSDEDYVYIDYHLYVQDSIWGRIKQAIKHIFGHRSRWGNFGCMCLEAEEVEEIRDYLSEWIENNEQIS